MRTATRLGLGLGNVLEVAPRVDQASGMDEALRFSDAVVSVIAVGQQNAFEAQEQTLGSFGTARRRIVEEDNIAFGQAASAHPHKMIARWRFMTAQDLQRGLVAMKKRPVEQMIIQQIDDRDYHLAELNH